jgi:hypothetical protein
MAPSCPPAPPATIIKAWSSRSGSGTRCEWLRAWGATWSSSSRRTSARAAEARARGGQGGRETAQPRPALQTSGGWHTAGEKRRRRVAAHGTRHVRDDGRAVRAVRARAYPCVGSSAATPLPAAWPCSQVPKMAQSRRSLAPTARSWWRSWSGATRRRAAWMRHFSSRPCPSCSRATAASPRSWCSASSRRWKTARQCRCAHVCGVQRSGRGCARG